MRILVTGASGFIGSALCRHLASDDDDVVAVVRGDRPTRGVRAPADFMAPGAWEPTVARADVVVHLAGIAHRRGVSEDALHRVNVGTTVALAHAVARVNARLVLISSAKVYGDSSGETPFDERSPLRPSDGYARSKAEAEAGIADVPGLRWVVLRPPLVYGPGVRANFLRLLRAVAWGLPLPLARVTNRRSLIGLENLCDAIGRCARSPAGDGMAFPVTDGEAVSTPALCRQIADAFDRPARLFPFPSALLNCIAPLRSLTGSLELDDQAFRRRFDWTPPRSLVHGLEETARWYSGRSVDAG